MRVAELGGGAGFGIGDGYALDDLIHGQAGFGLEPLRLVEILLAVVLYVALDAVQEVDAEVADGGNVPVALYTKSGSSKSLENKSGTTTHIFFWGLKEPVWNDAQDCAVLFEVNTWTVKRVG